MYAFVVRGGLSLLSVGGPELLLDDLLGRLRVVGGLERLVHADQRLLERVVAGRVDHLLLDLGRVRAPAQQEQLLLLGTLGRALALVRVLEVEQPVPALLRTGFLQVFKERVVRGVALADHLDVDLLLVLDVENHVPVLLVLLDLLVHLLTRVRYGHAGSHNRTVRLKLISI